MSFKKQKTAVKKALKTPKSTLTHFIRQHRMTIIFGISSQIRLVMLYFWGQRVRKEVSCGIVPVKNNAIISCLPRLITINPFYYIDTSVLLENIPLVKFIKTTSGTLVVFFP